MSHRISSEESVSLAEVEKRLKQREEAAPLNYIQRVTLDHAHRFSDQRAGNDLADLLMSTFELDRLVAVQLVNLCPKSLIDVTAVLGESVDETIRQKVLDFYTEHVAAQPEVVEDDEDEDEDEEFDQDEDDEDQVKDEDDSW